MKLGDGPMKIHLVLDTVFGTSCSYNTVCQSVQCFQGGKKYLRDELRPGSLKTAMDENVMELGRHAIADDPHLNSGNICYLSHGTVH